MTFEYNDKGKFFTKKISKEPVSVLVQTTAHLIQGFVHIRKEERLKDELDRESSFLALTEASVLDIKGNPLFQTDFIAIHRAQIIWVLPKKDSEKEENTL